MDSAYESYEKYYDIYSYINFQEHVKRETGLDVSLEFIKAWIDYLGDMAMPNEETIELLNYLESKYDLAVLTNGFKDSQEKRLVIANIREFFTDVYGGEEYMKPDYRIFIEACGPYQPEECLMIGDNYEVDIKGAQKAGLHAIHLNKKEESDGLTRIRSLNELKRIL